MLFLDCAGDCKWFSRPDRPERVARPGRTWASTRMSFQEIVVVNGLATVLMEGAVMRKIGIGCKITAASGSGVLLMFAATIFILCTTSDAQVVPGDAQPERCKQLLKKEISRLTDEQLRVLKVCLEPLERRRKEKAESADQSLAPAERKAPLRIYGK